jgi:hypothetical protein
MRRESPIQGYCRTRGEGDSTRRQRSHFIACRVDPICEIADSFARSHFIAMRIPVPLRLKSLLVMVLVLLGATAPAFACAMPSAERDCCPEGTPAPCEGKGFHFNALAVAAACCATAPQASTAWIASSRSETEQPQHASSPDPFVALAWLATFNPRSPPLPLPPQPDSRRSADGALTYLHTGRLRL